MKRRKGRRPTSQTGASSRQRPWTSLAARSSLAVLAALATVLVQVLSAGPATAHGFQVTLITSDASGTPPLDDSLAGFRLAVDLSPDVSHAPGSDAGDHLGGIDVDITESGSIPAVDADIVVILDGALQPDLNAWRSANPDGLVVSVRAASGPAATDPVGPSVTLTAADRTTRSELLGDFTDAFRTVNDRTPTTAEASGYDTGVLIDVLVADLGIGFGDRAALQSAAMRADAKLVSTQVAAVGNPPAEASRTVGPAGSPTPDASDSTWWPTVVAVVAVAVATVVAGLVTLGRRRTRRQA